MILAVDLVQAEAHPFMSSPQTITVTDENFEVEVMQSSVPVLVDFWATWCPPCRMLSPVVDEIATEKAGVAKVVKVNVEENQELVRRFKVQGIPLLLFFKGGELKDQFVGATSKKALVSKLEALI